MDKTDPAQIFELLHLSSIALPVGSFAYSQGLEQAIESGLVSDSVSAHRWILDCMRFNLGRQEGILWHAAYQAAHAADGLGLIAVNDRIFALKETAELRLESRQMGQSMAGLFSKWPAAQWLADIDVAPTGWTYTAAHAGLCAAAGLCAKTGLSSFLWSWCENQVLCAVKHVPLGQTDGQALLQKLKPTMATIAQDAMAMDLSDFGSASVAYAINSSRHETQYSRLFRS